MDTQLQVCIFSHKHMRATINLLCLFSPLSKTFLSLLIKLITFTYIQYIPIALHSCFINFSYVSPLSSCYQSHFKIHVIGFVWDPFSLTGPSIRSLCWYYSLESDGIIHGYTIVDDDPPLHKFTSSNSSASVWELLSHSPTCIHLCSCW